MRKPLKDVKVLDFTRLYAGPFCTMLLGDLGADVVKVEAPGGDPIRRQGPPFHKGQSMSFLAANRNKRSIVLDLKSDEGRAAAQKLAAKCDVLVENFRPGVMARLGLGFRELSAMNPRLIYASMSGMGADGPGKDTGGFDLTIQAEAGYMSITGERGCAPIKLGTSAFDLICGQYAMGAIVTSLFDRERTGKGQLIETSLFEGCITFLVDAAVEYFSTGDSRGKWGSEHSSQAPYKAFKSADGWIVIGAGIQNLFEGFMRVIDREDLIADERFLSVADRSANRDDLHAILDAEVLKWETDALLAALREADVPCAPVNSIAEALTHPQALHRGMIQTVAHPEYGDLKTLGPAVKYSGFDVSANWTAPPLLGADTDRVLDEWLGTSQPEPVGASSDRKTAN
ncbi:CoA transferase [Pikeienuella sp. HZG-20]|uniref:CaiB/BaiF CoA transferase family protein n=1 Tax=Paludibacillus litoralis TaxID=3133267 RepID=UPI0030EF5ADF